MSKLVIVESPAKAKTINKYLGKDYNVRASMGHVRDLPKSKLGVDIQHDFAPEYVLLADRKKTMSELKKLSKTASEIYLATDLDREGEAIAWHLSEALKLPAQKVRRVVFNEITKPAIQEAFNHPSDIDLNKVNAQQAREILDRVVGYQLSPLLWTKVRRGLSAGRVQSVTVRLIVEREREIEKFQQREYWEIEADLAPLKAGSKGPRKFRAKLTQLDHKPLVTKVGEEEQLVSLLDCEAAARTLTEELQGAPFVVKSVETKERLMPPYPPFNTSTLQQQASIQLRFPTWRTMRIAQQLYEGVELGTEGSVGLITYMRTDSLRISDQALGECRDFLSKTLPPDYLPERAQVYKSAKAAQGAHEAIRPTSAARTPESVKQFLEPDLYRLYDLIWRCFVASQMTPGRQAVIDVQVSGGRALFEAQGRHLIFDGHLRYTGFDSKSENELPPLSANDPLKLIELGPSQHFTKPPPRYTDATLVKMLEKLGIGRPSTYAPIIYTIQQRNYVKREKRQFFATDLGKLVTDQLVEHFGDIMDVKFTSHMEDRLDEVEEAKTDWLQTLREFYEPFSADLKKAEKFMKRPEPETTEFKCELCGKPMLKRWSSRGPFLGCSGYPECTFTQPLDREGKPAPRPAPEPTDQKCEKCGSPMVIRTGRNGRFMACSAYPKCKNTKSVDNPIEIPEELKTCEKCGKPMAVKRSRRGSFLGCTGYPDCKNAKPLPKAP